MTAQSPAVGDRLRVVEKATDGSARVVTQGTVVGVDAANNRLDFGVAKTKLTSTAQVDVKIENLWPELPTTPGSLLRDGVNYYFLTTRGWISAAGTSAPPNMLQRLNPTIVHVAGA